MAFLYITEDLIGLMHIGQQNPTRYSEWRSYLNHECAKPQACLDTYSTAVYWSRPKTILFHIRIDAGTSGHSPPLAQVWDHCHPLSTTAVAGLAPQKRVCSVVVTAS